MALIIGPVDGTMGQLLAIIIGRQRMNLMIGIIIKYMILANLLLMIVMVMVSGMGLIWLMQLFIEMEVIGLLLKCM